MESLFAKLAAGCLFILAVTGCGGSSTETAAASEDSTAEQAAPSAQPTEPAPPAAASSSTAAPESLDDYLGLAANVVRGDGAQGRNNVDQDEALEQQQLVQQQIQVCMQAQGFTYVPQEVGAGLQFLLGSQRSSQSAAQYAETEGFGISTVFDTLREGDLDLSDDVNPNDEYVESLSEGEADAWQFALRGAPPERNDQGQLVDPETGEAIQGRGATGGCQRQAQEEIRGDFAALAELAASFDELEARIAADPRVTEIARQWTSCMSAEGFDYQDEAEARSDIRAEFQPLIRSFFQGQAVQGQGGQGGDNQGGGNRLQAIAGLELSDEQEAELSTLQDSERAIATASVTCQGGADEEIAEIEATYEAEFVEANRSALEAIAG